MPRQKDLKRVVRTRMQKTGESYTAARRQIVTAGKPELRIVKEPLDLAKVAGMSESSIQKNTGHTWAEWTGILDAFGGTTRTHGEVAAHVHSLGVPGWWSQSVTVGYERIRGLRKLGQRRNGSWEASKSKTFPVSVDVLFDAWNDAKKRKRWLGAVKVKVRTATKPKSMRITWDDGTSVDLWFLDKGSSKSAVGVQHVKLASKAEADRLKAYWAERLVALGEMLAR